MNFYRLLSPLFGHRRVRRSLASIASIDLCYAHTARRDLLIIFHHFLLMFYCCCFVNTLKCINEVKHKTTVHQISTSETNVNLMKYYFYILRFGRRRSLSHHVLFTQQISLSIQFLSEIGFRLRRNVISFSHDIHQEEGARDYRFIYSPSPPKGNAIKITCWYVRENVLQRNCAHLQQQKWLINFSSLLDISRMGHTTSIHFVVLWFSLSHSLFPSPCSH